MITSVVDGQQVSWTDRKRYLWPLGLVVPLLPLAARDGRITHKECRFGAVGRNNVREQSVIEALKMLTEMARGPQPPLKKRPRAAAHRPHPRVSRTPRRAAGKRRRTSRPSAPRASDS